MLEEGEQRFVGVLYELPSNYSHIMNVAWMFPLPCPMRSRCGAMCRSWALPMGPS